MVSGSEFVLISGWEHENLHRSEIGRYEVHREESLSGFGMGMTIYDFQIVGIRHDVTESLKSAVRYSIALCVRFFM